ncbi:Chloroplast-targeted copper chaperone protein [Dorcoceras hygrometricum]|uniref:Chloroplast-targeted copper chaperone protein n=1 Tax=Dorcoceras hygrometricum TaxID=472368 RepID=A0A2Z7BXC8_9LAMI|nr:Chloroplast-targeted copper chaperone protein [Dorcoceras hygrometricum]
MKAAKKMKGFMCQNPASTSVCMAHDHRSVIVPRRLGTSLLHQTRLVDGSKCIRLGKTGALSTTSTVRSYPPVSSVKKDIERGPDRVMRSVALSDQVFQVVVMRVSLHCQACAGKVKKHLSKMEGVTSFSIDLEAKRVTVMGHVSPSGVLESISKVKKAEFWPNC